MSFFYPTPINLKAVGHCFQKIYGNNIVEIIFIQLFFCEHILPLKSWVGARDAYASKKCDFF